MTIVIKLLKRYYRYRLFLILLLFPIFLGDGCSEDTRFKERIENFLNRMTDSGFAYSALVSTDGHVIVQQGYGWTDSSKTSPTTDRTLFNIASITKSFTATAIFLLREQHRVSLTDSLPVFFKNVPADKQLITVSQLLTHTSGLRQNYLADGIASRDSAVVSILKDTLQFHPGTGFSYSNENYELLAAIIEIQSGMFYEEFVRNQILKKATMTDTKFWGEVQDEQNVRVASTKTKLTSDVLHHNWGYIGSGGMFSTIVDLHRWFTALTEGMILKRSSVEMMWTPQLKISSTAAAFGWFVSLTEPGTNEIWTRGTEDWGHNGVVRWFPERKILIIVLTNSGELGDKDATGNRIISDGILAILSD